MLENISDNVKRYAPPPQRNRVINRRKSGDRVERANYSHGSDGEKSQGSYSRNFSAVNRNEKTYSGIIAVEGCGTSEAARLLNDRWVAAMNSYNDALLESERPMMYSGAGGSSWGHLKLPHQMDFLSDLCRAIHNANIGAAPTLGARGPF